MPNPILFQLATQYLPRSALRLESLLFSIQQAVTETHPNIHHYALTNLFEVLKLTEKPELKSRFLKEFIRLEHAQQSNKNRLLPDALYAKLFVQVQILTHLSGRFGEAIYSDQFLFTLRSTQSAPTTDCELYPPALLWWLAQSSNERQQQFALWLAQLQSLQETIMIYLSLLRDVATFEIIHTQQGFFQRSLPISSCQLILLKMSKQLGLVPKIQIGHHGFNLHLCDANSMKETRRDEIALELAICQL